jgi:hypothetical protein
MKKWRQKSSCVAIFRNTEVKKSLPQIAHLRCHKSRCIAIGILTWVISVQIVLLFVNGQECK